MGLLTLYKIRAMADEFKIPDRIAVKMRIRYLLGELNALSCYLDGEIDTPPELDYNEILDELNSYHRFLKNPKPSRSEITEEMIQEARNVPVETLIEFTKGKARAWCHEDSNPSLTHDRKHNRAHCFPCSKSFNTIDILIERDGMTFTQAVRTLCK